MFPGVFTKAVVQKYSVHKPCALFAWTLKRTFFFDEAVYVLPWTSYPIQVSRTAVENGVVTPLYASLIRGVRSFATWVNEHVPIEISDLDDAPTLRNVIAEIASKLRPDDFIVAHNARFAWLARKARWSSACGARRRKRASKVPSWTSL